MLCVVRFCETEGMMVKAVGDSACQYGKERKYEVKSEFAIIDWEGAHHQLYNTKSDIKHSVISLVTAKPLS